MRPRHAPPLPSEYSSKRGASVSRLLAPHAASDACLQREGRIYIRPANKDATPIHSQGRYAPFWWDECRYAVAAGSRADRLALAAIIGSRSSSSEWLLLTLLEMGDCCFL